MVFSLSPNAHGHSGPSDKVEFEDNSELIFILIQNICFGPSLDHLGKMVLLRSQNIRFHAYHIYPAMRRVFCPSRMTSNN